MTIVKMDISARAASHFIKAANYYENIDFFNSINYFYNILSKTSLHDSNTKSIFFSIEY